MASFMRTIAVSVVLCGLIFLGYWRLTLDQQAKAIEELKALNDAIGKQLAEREAMIQRLGRSKRVAHLQITDQKKDIRGKTLETKVLFIELNDRGAEVARQDFAVPGDVLFVDAWTIKFDSERVAEGDPLRGRSLLLLRRIYSDQMKPEDGFAIDTPGAIPPAYAASDIGEYERRLWKNFWLIAASAEAAKESGVRIAQGEAVYKAVRAGQTYELLLDAVGGISLKPLDANDAIMTHADEKNSRP
jgi:hypothetical protein